MPLGALGLEVGGPPYTYRPGGSWDEGNPAYPLQSTLKRAAGRLKPDYRQGNDGRLVKGSGVESRHTRRSLTANVVVARKVLRGEINCDAKRHSRISARPTFRQASVNQSLATTTGEKND